MSTTSDERDDDGEPVFRLVYRSHSLIAAASRPTELGAIFTKARGTNRTVGVTGALITSDEHFVQALEGEERTVRELYERIAADERHDELTVLEEAEGVDRTFGRWAMARVGEGDGHDIRLMSNARKGTIVAAPGVDRSVTPEQETVLAFMRESLTGRPV